MRSLHGKRSHNLIFLIVASFALISILGIGMGMEMTGGEMSLCPFMAGQAATCEMNIMEHISQWQSTFLGIPTKANLLMLAIVLLAVALVPSARLFSKYEELTEFAVRFFVRYTSHIVKLFNPLLLAFSDGILNPKIYEPVRV